MIYALTILIRVLAAGGICYLTSKYAFFPLWEKAALYFNLE
mgnify:CR=1 FL=1